MHLGRELILCLATNRRGRHPGCHRAAGSPALAGTLSAPESSAYPVSVQSRGHGPQAVLTMMTRATLSCAAGF